MSIKSNLNMIVKVLRGSFFNIYSPLDATLILTNRCNNNCVYCQIPKNLKCDELNTEQVKKIIHELKKMGIWRISLSGGEPLIRDDIKEIIDYCHEKDIFVSLNTNGKLVKKRISDIKKVNLVVSSLDGSKKIHDSLKGEGSYDSFIEAMKTLKKEGIKAVSITVFSKKNMREMPHILELSKKLGFVCAFQNMHHTNPLSDVDKSLIPDRGELRGVVDFLIKEKKKKKGNIVNSISYLKLLNDFSADSFSNRPCEYYDNPDFKKIKCFGGRFHITINADGKIYACHKLIGGGKGYDFFEYGLKKALKFIQSEKKFCSPLCGNMIEFNSIFSYKPDSIKEAVKLVFSK